MNQRDTKDPTSYYVFENGWYHHYPGGDSRWPTFTTLQVAFVYDKQNFVQMWHGPPKSCADRMKIAEAKYRDAGVEPGHRFELQMVTLPNGFDVEEINRCLSTSGYLKVLLNKLGVTSALPS